MSVTALAEIVPVTVPSHGSSLIRLSPMSKAKLLPCRRASVTAAWPTRADAPAHAASKLTRAVIVRAVVKAKPSELLSGLLDPPM